MSFRDPWDPEPKAVTKALAPHRRGRAGELRETVRRMLLRLMGFAPDDLIDGRYTLSTHPPGKWPSHFGRNPLPTPEAKQVADVAHDVLRELGYDAAASIISETRYDESGNIDTHARDALKILEAGPPSIYLGGYLVYKQPVYRLGTGYLIARGVNEHARPWYRFAIGSSVYDKAGRERIGWDPEAGHTFQWRSKTLDEARAESYFNQGPSGKLLPMTKGRFS